MSGWRKERPPTTGPLHPLHPPLAKRLVEPRVPARGKRGRENAGGDKEAGSRARQDGNKVRPGGPSHVCAVGARDEEDRHPKADGRPLIVFEPRSTPPQQDPRIGAQSLQQAAGKMRKEGLMLMDATHVPAAMALLTFSRRAATLSPPPFPPDSTECRCCSCKGGSRPGGRHSPVGREAQVGRCAGPPPMMGGVPSNQT